jgi:hypothetical protein
MLKRAPWSYGTGLRIGHGEADFGLLLARHGVFSSGAASRLRPVNFGVLRIFSDLLPKRYNRARQNAKKE